MQTTTAPPQLFKNFRHENTNSQIVSPFNSPKSQKVYALFVGFGEGVGRNLKY